MNIDAFNPDGSPKYTSSNPQAFGEANGDYPTSAPDIAWTDFNGNNNVNTNEVSGIIDGSNVVTATFDFEQYIGQHNQGNHTALYGDVISTSPARPCPIPIVGPGSPNARLPSRRTGRLLQGLGDVPRHQRPGGSDKTITGYFLERLRPAAADRRRVHRGPAGRRHLRRHRLASSARTSSS